MSFLVDLGQNMLISFANYKKNAHPEVSDILFLQFAKRLFAIVHQGEAKHSQNLGDSFVGFNILSCYQGTCCNLNNV